MFHIATTRTIHTSAGHRSLQPWVWPLPDLNRNHPALLELAADGSHVELGYDTSVPLPRRVPVFAAHDGVVTYAGKAGVGYIVCLDHPDGWSTQYGNLDHMFAVATDRFRNRRKERVRAGDVLGYGSTLPIRFTLAQLIDVDEPGATIDPTDRMRTWLVLPWTEEAHAPSKTLTELAA